MRTKKRLIKKQIVETQELILWQLTNDCQTLFDIYPLMANFGDLLIEIELNIKNISKRDLRIISERNNRIKLIFDTVDRVMRSSMAKFKNLNYPKETSEEGE